MGVPPSSPFFYQVLTELKGITLLNSYTVSIIVSQNMNFSLNQILEIADDIHRKVFNSENSITVSDYINSIHQLQAYTEQIKSVSRRIEIIHRTCLNKIEEHVNKTKLNEEKINMIGMHKWGIEKYYHCPSIYTDTNVDIVPGIDTNVKIVKHIDMIPNAKIYWIEDIKQFAFRINNIVLKGNLGNIFAKGVSSVNVVKCHHGSKCANNKCPYWHSPATRNYTNASWVYSSDAINRKNRQMRHIGSRGTLNHDLEKMSRWDNELIDDEVEMLISQTMHDLLILMSLKSKGLLKMN